jgi:S-formylglutathione hydrolase FrmB
LVWRTSLLNGWLLPTITLLALALLTAGVAWWRRTPWTWGAIGVAALLAAALIARTAAPPSAVGGSYPRSFVLWGALPLFALAAAVWQWRVVRWWRRAVALSAVPLLAAFAGLQINAHYGYLPTLGDLVGAPIPGQVASLGLVPLRGVWVPASAAMRVRSGMGVVTQIDIPGRVSHFRARAAWVWLPPAYFTGPNRSLPVVMLLAGVPGATRDWLRGGFAARTADAWSRAHDGLAPILVFPDPNGSALADTECVDGPQGNSETYLTVDVPAFMHEHFHTATGPAAWAVGGLSEGATCALMLGARHPDQFSIFADFSGGKAPSSGNPAQTLERLYGGDRTAMLAHDPARWFALDARLGEQGIVVAGGDDAGALAAQAKVLADAHAVGFHLRTEIIPGGGHNFPTWGRALQQTFPWIATTLERTLRDSEHDVRA